MALPKMARCRCGNDNLAICKYENGWQHVECDDCFYMGPGEGSKLQAVRSHNELRRSEIQSVESAQ